MIFVICSYLYCIIYRDQQDIIMLGMIMGYAFELQWNMNGVVHEIFDIHKMMSAFDKCKKMCEIKQEAEMRKPIPLDENGQSWMSKGHIKFNKYSVKYRPDTEVVLKDIDIEIKSGEKVGVVGRTGAGKSTLCLALCRIIEKMEGNIKIDGVDISKVGLADLRERITIIPQEPVLFNNTLRFNLDPEHKCTDNQIIDMVKRAGLESLLTRDGNGIEFNISEKGENLSGGEKSLVCICRAALKKSKVVIMDEATASIDVNTEKMIQKLILDEFKEVTVITVAHRLNTIMHSDKILVMGFGEVIEFDSPKTLLEDDKSSFSDLVTQFNK